MAGETMKFIDVRRAFAEKNPALRKRIPPFVFRCMERLIHQEEMNGFMREHIGDTPVDFATAALRFFQVSVQVSGEENIPVSGRKIVVSNHPLGGLDGLTLISVLGRFRQDLKFPVNDLLMQLTPMKEVFVPVNKHGRTGTEGAMLLNDVFASDALVLYFPAGLCSRKIHGEVRDLEWKKSIVSKAKEYERDIVPVFFDARNSRRFYRWAAWRRKLGIKANVEMALLPDEAFRQKGNVIPLTFGPEICYQHFDDSLGDKAWAAWLKEKVYALKTQTV